LRICGKEFVAVIKQICPKTLTLIRMAEKGISDLVSNFLKNKKEVEIRSRLINMNYDDNKIDIITNNYIHRRLESPEPSNLEIINPEFLL